MSAALALGLALALIILILVWHWFRSGALSRFVSRRIERRLGGYEQVVRTAGEGLPLRLSEGSPTVAVIGGGLAGIGAASALGERGFAVTLYEANEYLGGKIGAWQFPVGDETHTIEHGFHAFFRQYYNLNAFLSRVGAAGSFKPIEDYLIIHANRDPQSFGDISTVPGVNLLSLGWHGFYRFKDVIRAKTRKNLAAFLRFDMRDTYEELDAITFKQFCDDAAVPESLRVSFRTFARAFFSDEADLSAAEVIRAFHFYYLSHDRGLLYDYPAGNYEDTLLAPIRKHLESHGVALKLGKRIGSVERSTAGLLDVDGRKYDWVIIACDVPGAKTLLTNAGWLRADFPETHRQLEKLEAARGYAVWRIWADRDLPGDLPTFINFDRRKILDSVTRYHLVTDEARDWAARHRGAVLELHSYALPPKTHNEAAIRQAFLDDLTYFYPDLSSLGIVAESLQVRNDFPAFGPGQRADRPEPRLPVEGLLLAGDWVKLPFPMTHMEAAFTSGLVCANHILAKQGLAQVVIRSVPTHGLWHSL